MPFRLLRFVCLAAVVSAVGPSSLSAQDRGRDFFETKIRPVLVRECYGCHSSKAKGIKGGLRLDTRRGLRRGGDSGPAVVPKKVGDSLLISALKHETFEMPPKGKLPGRVIADFVKWIEMGAPDPRGDMPPSGAQTSRPKTDANFWAFQPPRDSQPPRVKDKSWPSSNVDRFILAKLETAGLTPASDAPRSALLRRAYFTLIGLPPTPEEIIAFEQDSSDQAFAKVIDRLLDSPHFGERWGRHWLDVARYAESSGGGRTQLFKRAWRYRDYVIRSFNADKPFNQFAAEQIAGDLMPSTSAADRAEKITALGFLVLGPTNYELQDKELLRMEVVDEQIDTMGRAFLGLTIGCARCHDHKFDPIPTRDYYALAGIFRSTKTLTPGNVSGWVERELPVEEDRRQALVAYKNKLAPLEKRLAQVQAELKKASGGQPKRLVSSALPGIVMDDRQAKHVGNWMKSTSVATYIDEGYIHDRSANDGRMAISFAPKLPHAGRFEVRIAYTAGTNRAARTPITVVHADGTKTIRVDQRKRPKTDGVFHSLGKFRFTKGTAGSVTVGTADARGVVIADAVQFLPLDGPVAQPTKKQQPQNKRELARLRQLVQRLNKQINGLKKEAPPAPEKAMSVRDEQETGDFHVCIRGNVHNLGERVARGALSVITPKPLDVADKQSGRLQLAEWLTQPDNPLFARVMVNRVWTHLFGVGLVRTPDNFGQMGERPSHPALLDHLAVEFAQDGWSIKRLIRRIMLSHVYRIDSVPDDRAGRADPENRLLARAHRRRLDAESIRDAMLAISGELDQTRFGSSIPAKVTTELGFSFATKRRSVYVPVFRNTLLDLFEVFDFADPNLVVGLRNTSAVPTQALFMMNSPFVAEQSEKTADRLVQQAAKQNTTLQVDAVYRTVLGRAPSAREEAITRKHVAAPVTSAKWADVVQALFGSVDFRYLR